jgi:hypothetical protein
MLMHTRKFMIGGLTIVFGLVLLPGLALADSSGAKPPTPTLQGPSTISTNQPFKLSFSYPKGEVKSYALETLHCRPGTNAPPSDDNNSEPWPVQGCEPATTTTPSTISPDSGQVTIDVKYGVTAIHQYNTKDFSARDTAQWLQGNWYVRTRLISTSGVQGSWSNWHHTFIGSPNIGKPIGIKGAVGDRSRVSSTVVMRGLAPPVIATPTEGQVFHGEPPPVGFITASGTLPPHARYSDWACCDIEWQRANVVTQENNAYVAAHTPPGGIPQSGFPTARSPWHTSIGLNGGSRAVEIAPTFHGGWTFDQLRPHSHKLGNQYWFRVREHYTPGNAPGPWSDWRSFIVQEPAEAIEYPMPHGGAPSLPGQGQSAQKPGTMHLVNPQLNPQPEPPSPSAPRLQLPTK